MVASFLPGNSVLVTQALAGRRGTAGATTRPSRRRRRRRPVAGRAQAAASWERFVIGLDEAFEEVREEFREFFFGDGGAKAGAGDPEPVDERGARRRAFFRRVAPGAGRGGRFPLGRGPDPERAGSPGVTIGVGAGGRRRRADRGRHETTQAVRPGLGPVATLPERIDVSVSVFLAALVLEVAWLGARGDDGDRDDLPAR